METWRKIDDTNYSISDNGVVRNDKTGRILKPCNGRDGYLRVPISYKGKTTLQYVHRLVLGPSPDVGLQVNHIDGNIKNNSICNLEWVTRSENIRHSIDTLKHKRGGRGKAKITPDQVREIRLMHGIKSNRQLAKEYNVCHVLISLIQSRKRWTSII